MGARFLSDYGLDLSFSPLSDCGHCHFFVFPDSGVVPFREGWRPAAYGTPTLTEWPAPSFVLFFLFPSQFMFNISAVREIQNDVS